MPYENVLLSLPEFAADILVKATLLLTAVVLIDFSLRQRSAAVRHRVWATAFVGLLVLPFLSFVVPEYRLAILPANWMAGEQVNANNDAKPAAAQAVQTSTAEVVAPTADRVSTRPNYGMQRLEPRLPSSETTIAAEQVGVSANLPRPPNASSLIGSGTTRGAFSAIGIVALAWSIGLFSSVSPLVLGVWRIMLLQRKSPVIEDLEPKNTLAELCRRLGILRAVRLLETEQAIVPMTWGMRSPVVLVPSTWRNWAVERRRLVLLHELAHIKRLDVVYQSIARVACSLYWFHPLAWFALKRLRIERELACDDCVLMAGERPSQYAEQLLTIAREYQSMEMPPAVAMAQRSGLENRVRAMLDQARSHLPLNPKVAVGMLVASVAMLVLLAPIRLGAIAPINVDADTTEDQPLTKSTKEDTEEPVSSQTKLVNSNADDTYLFKGTVVHPDGTPAAGASLHWVYYEQGRRPDSSIPPVATADAKGAFEIRGFPGEVTELGLVATKSGYGLSNTKPGILFEPTGKLAAKSKEGMAMRLLGMFGNDTTLRLVSDDQPLTGRILTVDGTPLANAQIRVSEVSSNPKGNLDGWERATQHPKADYYSLRNEVSDGINGFQMPSILPDAMTDTNGKFTLLGLGKERITQLIISGPGIETTLAHARTRAGKTIRVPHQFDQPKMTNLEIPDEVFYANGFDYVAAPSVPVEGRIVDDSTGDPLSGFLVTAGHQVMNSRGGKPYIATVTDQDGRYTLSGLSQSNEDTLFVVPPRGSKYLPLGARPKTKDARTTIKLDLKLKPGTILRGRAMDVATGKPIDGAVQYYALSKNPNLADHRSFASFLSFHECRTDQDGRYAIAVLPGEGVLTFNAADHPKYPRASRPKTKTGEPVASSAMRMYETVPFYVHPTNYHFVKELQIDKDAAEAEWNIGISSGKSLSVRVVDSNGKPAPKAILKGMSEFSGWYPVMDGSTEIEGYLPDQGRELFAFDPDTHQAAHLKISGPQTKKLTLTLRPAGSLRGRLVDKQGVAVPDVRIRSESIPDDDSGDTRLRVTSDKDGRFELYGVVPGYKHKVTAFGDGIRSREIWFDIEVDPTNGFDLGDVVVDAKE